MRTLITLILLGCGFGVPAVAPAETVGFAMVGLTDRDALAAVVQKSLEQEGRELRDLSGVYWGIKDPLEAGACDAPPPEGLSKKLQTDWETGTAVCRARAGQPPYGPRNGDAFLTGRFLWRVLWQRFLEDVRPDRVLEVWGSSKRDGTWTVSVTEIMVESEKEQWMNKKGVAPSERDGALGEALREVLEGKGKNGSRWLTRELPLAPADDPFFMEGPPQYVDPLEVPEGCAQKLPATLVVEPSASPAADSLVQSWASTVAKLEREGRAPGQGEWKCSAMSYPLKSDAMGSLQDAPRSWMRCGERAWSAGGIEFALSVPKVRLKHTRGILKSMVKRVCQESPAPEKTKARSKRPGRKFRSPLKPRPGR